MSSLQARECDWLPGQLGLFTTVPLLRHQPVKFNPRRWQLGVQVKINELIAYDLTNKDKIFYFANCAGGSLPAHIEPNIMFHEQVVDGRAVFALRAVRNIAAGEELILPWYF